MSKTSNLCYSCGQDNIPNNITETSEDTMPINLRQSGTRRELPDSIALRYRQKLSWRKNEDNNSYDPESSWRPGSVHRSNLLFTNGDCNKAIMDSIMVAWMDRKEN